MVLVLSPEEDRVLRVSVQNEHGVVREVRSKNETHTGWLVAIDEALRQANVAIRDITGVVLVEKQSSFTGTRLMHTIGNTLAYARHIPIIGVPAHEHSPEDLWKKVHQAIPGVYVHPTYYGEPNIGSTS